ncbi:hypothetical protein AMJ86_03780 [bacterium SM23_57]|nr:MAG: hypothetical protein AMJ86_03780 [bacterium SM23_57]
MNGFQGTLTVKDAVRRGKIITASMMGATVVYFVVFWLVLGKTQRIPVPFASWVAAGVSVILPALALQIKGAILKKMDPNDELPINLGRWLSGIIIFYVVNEGSALSVMVAAMVACEPKALGWVIIPVALMVITIPKEHRLKTLLTQRGIAIPDELNVHRT